MHKKERSRLHHMALSYADLLAKLVDNNEKVLLLLFIIPLKPRVE